MRTSRWVAISLLLIFAQALVLWWLGQPAICECGYVKVWQSAVLSPENSQHLTDWYTLSHVIHGFVFYGVLYLFARRLPWGMRLALAIGMEVSWEIFENTPYIINAYRETALAQGYTGDSIINSVFDTLAAGAGFLLARRLPWTVTLMLALVLEGIAGWAIRDNLTLNILNFTHAFPWIESWQSGK